MRAASSGKTEYEKALEETHDLFQKLIELSGSNWAVEKDKLKRIIKLLEFGNEILDSLDDYWQSRLARKAPSDSELGPATIKKELKERIAKLEANKILAADPGKLQAAILKEKERFAKELERRQKEQKKAKEAVETEENRLKFLQKILKQRMARKSRPTGLVTAIREEIGRQIKLIQQGFGIRYKIAGLFTFRHSKYGPNILAELERLSDYGAHRERERTSNSDKHTAG